MAGNYVIIASGHKVMPPVGQINHAGCILYKVAGALSLLSLSLSSALVHDVYFLPHTASEHGWIKRPLRQLRVLFAKVAAARGRLWIRRRRRKLAARQRANNRRFSFSVARAANWISAERSGRQRQEIRFAPVAAQKLSGSVALNQKAARKLSSFLVHRGL